MKKIIYILIAFSFVSCVKTGRNYTLNQRDYDLIPYQENDTITVTVINDTIEHKICEQLIVDKEELSTLSERNGLMVSDLTFERYTLEFSSLANTVIKKGTIQIFRPSGVLRFYCDFDFKHLSFSMEPFDADENYSNHEYYPELNIDDKLYQDVYLMKDGEESLYYSSQTGFVKLTSPNGTILFERK